MFLKSININSEIITPSMPNYTLASWFPDDDAPVSCNKKGDIISVFSDNVWDFTPYCLQSMKINFGDNCSRNYIIDADNIRLFKIIAAYWLWGACPKITARTLVERCKSLKPLIYMCSEKNILISELSKHEEFYQEFATKFSSIRNITILQELVAIDKQIGFTVLDETSLRKFSKYLVRPDSNQTAYIPPRIWSYQLQQLETCIDDFLSVKQNIISIFNCFRDNHNLIPFGKRRQFNKEQINKHPKVVEVLKKWTAFSFETSKISNISSYLSMVSFASIAYIINFSLMRINEAYLLRYGCFSKVEIDGQEICLIHGVTSKTIKDKQASWVVSPLVEKAITALEVICELRFSFAKEEFGITKSIEEYKPVLYIQAFEPWVGRKMKIEDLEYIKKPVHYNSQIKLFNKIFDQNEIKLTQVDFSLACHITPNLDENLFQIGKPWHFSWHQLRRTGAVNMLASGLVTEQSLQYQLKHINTIMSLYYANNFYKLKFKLDDTVGQLYLEEWHQNNVRENKALESTRFISPHGEKRKVQIISTITEKDHNHLLKMSEKGTFKYRKTFLGGCTKTGDPCPFGGITNIVSCMGGNGEQPCDAVLLDREKLPLMYKLEQFYIEKIQNLKQESIDTTFDSQQLSSIRRAINVINEYK